MMRSLSCFMFGSIILATTKAFIHYSRLNHMGNLVYMHYSKNFCIFCFVYFLTLILDSFLSDDKSKTSQWQEQDFTVAGKNIRNQNNYSQLRYTFSLTMPLPSWYLLEYIAICLIETPYDDQVFCRKNFSLHIK